MNRTHRISGKAPIRTLRTIKTVTKTNYRPSTKVSETAPSVESRQRPSESRAQKSIAPKKLGASDQKFSASEMPNLVKRKADVDDVDCLDFSDESSHEHDTKTGSCQRTLDRRISEVNTSATPPAGTSGTDRGTSGTDLYQESIDLIYQCDPNQDLSKEDLIERLEHKYNNLKKTHADSKELRALRHILSNLREEERTDKIQTMNVTREKQDQIVRKNKLEKEHFTAKTNLTPEDYKQLGEDEQLAIVKTSKKYFEKIKHYQTAPKTVVNHFQKGKTRGNRQAPNDLLASIDAKFAVH